MGRDRWAKAEDELGQHDVRTRATPPAPHAASRRSPAGMLALQRAIGNRAAYRLVQCKLDVGPAGDHFEDEADRMADIVMRNLASVTPDGGGAPQISRSIAEGAVGLEGGPVAPDAEAAIHRHRSQGAPLPGSLRSSMEGSFGADFGGVRVHTGPAADDLNRSMQARAFTVGRDIFFSEGTYQPGTTSGQRLLAHELTHTVQQGAVELDGS